MDVKAKQYLNMEVVKQGLFFLVLVKAVLAFNNTRTGRIQVPSLSASPEAYCPSKARVKKVPGAENSDVGTAAAQNVTCPALRLNTLAASITQLSKCSPAERVLKFFL